LDSFRYALSGEFAFIRSLARGIRISPTWGLEVSMLSEVYQNTSVNRICQVEIMETYEHKHQTLKKENPNEGLIKMAADISKALFRVMSQDGIVMSDSFFRTLLTTYLQESRIAIEKFNALSLINGLDYDRHSEIEGVEAFVEALRLAQKVLKCKGNVELYIANELCKKHYLYLPVRNFEKAQKVLKCKGNVELIPFLEDMTPYLKRIQPDVVINLLEFIQMSALGADKYSRSRYFQTKAKAEEYLINSGLNYTIFRPSIILGKEQKLFGCGRRFEK